MRVIRPRRRPIAIAFIGKGSARRFWRATSFTILGTGRTERARLGVVEQELAEVATGGADLDADDEDATDDLTIKQGNVRTIHSSLWARTPEEFSYTVRGNGFLHHMVRNLVGTFLQVGKGSLQPDDIPAILAAKNRSAAGPTAPACGLYLVSVEYVMP